MEVEDKSGEGADGAGQEKEFDVNAFTEEVVAAPVVADDGAAAPESKTDEEAAAGDDDSAAFTWDAIAGGAESEDEKTARLETEAADKIKADELAAESGGEEVTQEQKDAAAKLAEEAKLAEKPNIAENDSFKVLNEELGTKFETIDEMKDHLVKMEAEKKELLQNQNAGLDNERIQNLKKLKTNSDEDLVKMDLERQGFKDENLQNALDKITDNGMIEIEAQKIKNTIDNAIGSEQNKITESNGQADAKQQQDYEDNVKALNTHLSETKTMFGFNMAKDDESLKVVRAEHQEYITSGDFLTDVTKDTESITEAAWMWKHRETLLKAIGKKGHTEGREEILNDIGIPETTKSNRMKGPEADDGFDASKFTFGT